MCESEREAEPIINRFLDFVCFSLVTNEHAFSVFIFILTLLVPFLSKLKSPQMNEGESRAPAAPQP